VNVISDDGVLVVRSGRHLEAAVASLRRTSPDARIAVLGCRNPGGTGADELGIAPSDWLEYTAARLSVAAVLPVVWRLFRRGRWFRRVAMLWDNVEGWGYENVVRAAMCFLPVRLLAIQPDGTIRHVEPWRMLAHRCAVRVQRWRTRVERAVASVARRLEGAELEPRLWHSHYLAARAFARDIPSLVRDCHGLVLDIGAGTGHAARYLDARKTRYLPTDLPTGRDPGDQTVSTKGIRPCVLCDGRALPLRDASVDAAMSHSVLEHVADVQGMLREAWRVLRPGGRLVVLVPFLFPFHGEPGDFRRWTTHGLGEELRAAGFTVERSERVGGSLAALIVAWHLFVKYELRPRAGGRLAFVLLWPLLLVGQGMLNLVGLASRPGPRTQLPMAVAAVARKGPASAENAQRDLTDARAD
jgi:SAM-dependent methyltransferase